MSDKEASVFIVDVGASMGKKRHDRTLSDLDYSLQYIWDKITNIVYQGRKTLMAGVIGLRTTGTKNHMQQDDGYEHISLIQAIQSMDMASLQRLPDQLVSSTTDSGDALSAVILAVDMMIKHCRDLKYIKRIYLVTNGTGPLDPDDIEPTAAQIVQGKIELTVLGVDFDDAEYGFKEENKPHQKRKNEEALKKLVDLSGGVYGTMQEAIEGLARPHIKQTRPVPTYKGRLTLGDPQNYDTAISIDIERYFKVSIRRPPTASAFVVKDGMSQSQAGPSSVAADGNALSTVRNAYTYSVTDPTTPTGRRDVAREDLAKGYEYGRTAVPLSESDENITKLETDMSYSILGFIPVDNVERYMVLENSNMLVAQKMNTKAALALSSFVHALYELGSVAVARFVKKDMAEPQLTLLSPLVTNDIECLIENDLPFAEDLRSYRFPPLDKILTVSGKSLTSHRNLPSAELQSAMDNLVDSMSLMQTTDEGEEERLAMEDCFSPLLHTIESAIKHRAIHPEKPVEAKSNVLMEPSRPPSDLIEAAQSKIDTLIAAADVKKVPPKAKGRRRYREAEKPLSGLDVDALLNSTQSSSTNGKDAAKRRQIDPKNAIPEFKRILDRSTTEDESRDAVRQMSRLVHDLIKSSFGDQHYDRALEMLGVMRQEMIEYEWPEFYNEALQDLKSKIFQEELGGDRTEFWTALRRGRLGLIDHDQSEASKVSKDEAAQFFQHKR